MSDREAFIEFARGAAFFIGIGAVFLLFVVTLGKPESKTEEKFKIVDHYGDCAIVRYSPKSEARYVYFLDCQNQHLREGG
jgi:hypothetical protein